MDRAELGRRQVLVGAAALAASAFIAPRAEAAPNAKAAVPAPALALQGNHKLEPLVFDPAKLNGLSERMMRSHHENNYGGAVKNLNRVERELSSINKDTPGFLVAALRERELTFRGSKLLHEQYFGTLGGDGR